MRESEAGDGSQLLMGVLSLFNQGVDKGTDHGLSGGTLPCFELPRYLLFDLDAAFGAFRAIVTGWYLGIMKEGRDFIPMRFQSVPESRNFPWALA